MGFFDRIINFFRIKPIEEPPTDENISLRREVQELREELADLRRELAERDIEEIRDIDEKEVEEEEESEFEPNREQKRKEARVAGRKKKSA